MVSDQGNQGIQDPTQKANAARKYAVAFVVIVILGSIWAISSSYNDLDFDQEANTIGDTLTASSTYATTSVSIKGTTFIADIADTDELREQGLSGRSSLQPQQAMIFAFPTPARYSFWMKDMNFPLDMVWIDASGTVVYTKDDAKPENYPEAYTPDLTASAVIELSTGIISKMQIKIGDKIIFDENILKKATR